MENCLFLSGKRDSNSRPRPWQGRALPTELLPQFLYVPRAGLEPARPQWSRDFKSRVSTNSTTKATIGLKTF